MRSFARDSALFIGYRVGTRTILFSPYLYWYLVNVKGLSPVEYGWFQALYSLIAVGAEIPAGLLADYWGRRRILVVAAILNFIGCAIFPLTSDIHWLALGQILFGLTTSLISGADSAYLYDLAHGRTSDSGLANARYRKIENLSTAAMLLSLAIGLPLTDRLLMSGQPNPAAAYWVTAGLSAIAAACAWSLSDALSNTRRPDVRTLLRSALGNVFSNPRLKAIFLYSAGVFVWLRCFNVSLFNVYLLTNGYRPSDFGKIMAMMSLFGAASSWTFAHHGAEHWNWKLVVAIPLILSVAYAFALLGSGKVILIVCGLVGIINGINSGFIRGLINPLVTQTGYRATVLSLESMLSRIAFGALAPIVGWTLSTTSLASSFIVAFIAGGSLLIAARVLWTRQLPIPATAIFPPK